MKNLVDSVELRPFSFGPNAASIFLAWGKGSIQLQNQTCVVYLENHQMHVSPHAKFQDDEWGEQIDHLTT
jgi:hypothetical protein